MTQHSDDMTAAYMLGAYDARDLAALVKSMRDAQREYFRTRTQESLRKSKALEAQVDKRIEQWNLP